MKNIIKYITLFLLLITGTISSFAQTYDKPGNYGLQYKRLKADSSFKVPILPDTQRRSNLAGNGDIIYVQSPTGSPDTGFWIIEKGWYKRLGTSSSGSTLQQVLDAGREGDSMLISNNLFIGTTQAQTPTLLTVIGDSRDQAVSGGPSYLRVWSYRLADFTGWTFDGSLAIPSTFFMNLEPRYNPLDDSSAVMDIILTDAIRNQSVMGDTNHYIVVTRCINDLFYYTKAGGTNYTPENFGASYRIFMDSLVAKGKDMNHVVLMGPKYVSATSTQVTRDSVFRWIDTVRQVAADYGAKFFDAFAYEAARGGDQLLGIDNFHENVTGHTVLLSGMLNAIGYQVPRDEQKLAVNGNVEVNNMTIRGGDTSTGNNMTVHTNSLGKMFLSDNINLRNNTFDSLTQEADGNINRMKARLFESQGLNSVSFTMANNTAIRGKASTAGALYIDASQDLTGTVWVRATTNTTFSSTGIFNSVAVTAPTIRASTAFQGNAASNGTLYIDASQNTTGTINLRAGSTTTFTSAGVQMTALNVNNNAFISSAGVFTEYKNGTPTQGMVLVGNGTELDTSNITLAVTDMSSTAITATGSLTLTDPITTRPINATSGNIILTLNGAVGGRIFNFKRTDATANTVTITPSSGTVDGQASITVLDGGSIYFDGTNYTSINQGSVKGRQGFYRTTVSSAGTLNLTSAFNHYVFSGTTTTWTLPTLTGNTDVVFFIKNRGSGNITLNSNAGGNDIYDTAPVNTITIAPGEARIVWGDGTYFDIE